MIALLAGAAAACSDDGGDVDAYCATADRFAVDNLADAFRRIDPADPQGTASALDSAAATLRGWADDAPVEVRDDVELLADAAADLAVAFAPEQAGAADPAAVVDTDAVEAASARVVTFTVETCQVDLDPGG